MLRLNIAGTPDEVAQLLSMFMYDKNRQFDRVEAKLDSVLQKETEMKIDITQLLATVAQEKTVDDSIVALLNQVVGQNVALSAELKDAIASNDPVALQAVQDAIDASVVTMKANMKTITDAVTTFTPPPPPPPPLP